MHQRLDAIGLCLFFGKVRTRLHDLSVDAGHLLIDQRRAGR